MKQVLLSLLFTLAGTAAIHAQVPGMYPPDSSSWHGLQELFRNREVVGLGEATHGTREFFRERFSISRYLIENCGYRSIIIEADFGSMLAMNNYVKGGAGHPDSILKQVGSWLYYTKEMGDFARWVRSYNDSHADGEKVYFLGMDMLTAPVNTDSIDPWQPLRALNQVYAGRFRQGAAGFRDSCMAENVLAIGRLTRTKSVIWAHNLHIMRRDQQVDNASLRWQMGEHLDQALGEKYYPIGFFFDRGEFMVMHRLEKDGKIFHPYLRSEKMGSSDRQAFTKGLAKKFLDGFLYFPEMVTGDPQFRDFSKPQKVYMAGSMIIRNSQVFMITPIGPFRGILFLPESSSLVQTDDGIRKTKGR